MALVVGSASFSLFRHRRQEIRAVASEEVASLKIEEDKIKLGGSDLKVSKLGIGAWAWGDTGYWNDSAWDGVLTGKYTPEKPPSGPRGKIYTPEVLKKLQPFFRRIKDIGENYGKTTTQVVLNWLVCQDNVLPIPGAKTAVQAKEFGGALGWRLTGEEIRELRSLASEAKVEGLVIEEK